LKILCTGDLHIDEKLFDQKVLRNAYLETFYSLSNNPHLTIESQYPSLIEIIEASEDVDMVVLLGDIFGLDDNHYSTIAERYLFTDFIWRIKKPIYIIYGNHEVAHDLDSYSKFKHVTVITDYMENEMFKFLSFPSRAAKDSIDKFLSPSNKILFTHAMFSGANMGTGKIIKYDTKFTLPSSFDSLPGKIIITGHVHIPQDINNFIFYVGSTNRLNFGEMEEKSFIILDTDSLYVKRIPLTKIRVLHQYVSTFSNNKFVPPLPNPVLPLSKLTISIAEEDLTKLPYASLSDFYKIEYVNTTPIERRSRSDTHILKGNTVIDKCSNYLNDKHNNSNKESILKKVEEIYTLIGDEYAA
jgi:DNA repair exonuclease SbcCD nuclease subunit